MTLKPWETEFGNIARASIDDIEDHMRRSVRAIEDKHPRGYWVEEPHLVYPPDLPAVLRPYQMVGWYGVFVREPDDKTFFEMTAELDAPT